MKKKPLSKVCFKCNANKPLEGFYKHPMMSDGRVNKCKECNKKDVSGNYRSNRDHYVEYDKQRSKDPKRKKMANEYTKQRRKRNPEKSHARSALAYAVKKGRIKRLPCEKCGATERIQAHHEDYSKPLDVNWFCFKCHREHHGQIVSQ